MCCRRDGFTGFNAMYEPDPLTQQVQVKEAGCWAHWRRKFFDFQKSIDSPIAKEALDRISKLYDVERTITGKTKDQRQAMRDIKSRPLTESLKTWLEARLKELPGKIRADQRDQLRPLKMGCLHPVLGRSGRRHR